MIWKSKTGKDQSPMTCMSNIYAHLTLMMVEKVKHSASTSKVWKEGM
jgi:hypothetical protein